MKNERRLLRPRVTAGLIFLAIAMQVLALGAAQAHRTHRPACDRSYGSYQGTVADRPTYFWSGQSPNDFRHDDTPTFSQRVGTN